MTDNPDALETLAERSEVARDRLRRGEHAPRFSSHTWPTTTGTMSRIISSTRS
jgi:hypothetical protein